MVLKQYSLLAVLFLLSLVVPAQAQVGIGTLTPDANALLHLKVNGTPRGLLLPQVSTADRTTLGSSLNVSHAGMLVADTSSGTGGIYVWNGTAWVDLSAGGSSLWQVSGGNNIYYNLGNVSVGTITADHRLVVDAGTGTDPFVVRSNGSAYLRMVDGGNVGIGSYFTPLNALDIDGGVVIGNNYRGSVTAPANGLLVEGFTGIGTTNPIGQLTIVEEGSQALAAIIQYQGTDEPLLAIGRANGTEAVPSHTLSGNRLGQVIFIGHDGSQFTGGASIMSMAQYNWNVDKSSNMIFSTSEGGDPLARMIIDPRGNVGMGTILPDTTLHVVGKMRYQDGTEQTGYVLTSDANGIATWQAVGGSLPAGVNTQTLYNNAGTWTATSNMTNDGTGVGIGASPTGTQRLAVAGSASNTYGLQVNTANVGAGSSAILGNHSAGSANAVYGVAASTNSTNAGSAAVYATTATAATGMIVNNSGTGYILRAQKAGADQVVIDNNGNLGVGTTSPQQRLGVAGGIVVDQGDANTGTLANTIRFGNGSSEGIGSKRSAGGNQFGLDFYTQTVNRMSITNTGNVGIGTTGPSTLLDVNGTSTFRGLMDLGANRITNVATPTVASDAATKGYVDGLASGTNFIQNQNAADQTASFRITGSGQLSGPLTLNGGTMNLGNGISNMILYNTSGIGAPTLSTRSVGSKVVLYPAVSATTVDMALGAEAGAMWLSVPNNANDIRFYAANNLLMAIRGNGSLQINNIISNRKIVLYETAPNDHEFAGFGINAGVLRYQSPGTVSDHVFYAATSATTSNELMRIQGNGRVGIGTAAPATMLDVNGEVRVGNTGLTPAAGNAGALRWNGTAIQYSNGVAWANIAAADATTASNGLTLTGANITLGGTLTQNTTISQASNDFMVTNNGAGNTVVNLTSTGDYHVLSNASAYALSVLNTGNVGIGTSTPATKLDVNGTSTFRGIMDMGANRITNMATPTAASDAATKGYVDGQASSYIQNQNATDQVANFRINGQGSTLDKFRVGTNSFASNAMFLVDQTSDAIGAQVYTNSPWPTSGYPALFLSNTGLNGQALRVNTGFSTFEGGVSIGNGNNPPAAGTILDVNGTLRYVNGTQAAGYVLTSDAAGNATWAAPFADNLGNHTAITHLISGTDNTWNLGSALGSWRDFYLDGVVYMDGSIMLNNLGTNSLQLGVGSGIINTGASNTFLGANTGNANAAGASNTFVGHNAGLLNTASFNTFVGAATGDANTSGTGNTFLGAAAGGANSTASNNTFVGGNAGLATNTGWGNTYVGFAAGRNATTATRNTFVGDSAGVAASTTSTKNVFIGHRAAQGASFVQNSVVVGEAALHTASGATNSELVIIGDSAAFNQSSAYRNVVVGARSGMGITTGGYNTILGTLAGNGNLTGSNNILIGYNADVGSGALSNATAIGANAVVSTSNSMVLGNNVNVGIGTSSPSSKLHVTGGNITYANGTQGAGRILQSDATGIANWVDPSSLSIPQGTGAINQVAYWNGTTSLVGNAGFTYDGTQLILNETASSGSIATFTNTIAGTDGSTIKLINTGTRTVGHFGTYIENSTTKNGGSNSIKTGVEVISTGAWGLGGVGGHENKGINVVASGGQDANIGVDILAGPNGSAGSNVTGLRVNVTNGTTTHAAQFQTGNVMVGNGTAYNKLSVMDANTSTTDLGAFVDIHNTNATSGTLSGIRFKNNASTANDRFNGAIFSRWNAANGSKQELSFAVKTNSAANVASSDIKMTLTEDGLVGIGTVTPAAHLHVRQFIPEIFIDNTNLISSAGVEIGSIAFGDARSINTRTAEIRAVRDAASTVATDLPASLEFYTVIDNTTTQNKSMAISNGGTVMIDGDIINDDDTSQKGIMSSNTPFKGAYILMNPGGAGAQPGDLLFTHGDYTVGAGSAPLSSMRWRWGENGTAREDMTLSSAGNLGIGVTAPLARLDIDVPITNTTVPKAFDLTNYYSGTGTKYGIDVLVTGDGSGVKYGIRSNIDGLAGDASSNFGMYTQVDPFGTGGAYGNYIYVSGNGTGARYGTRTEVAVAAANTSNTFGEYTYVYGSTSTTGANYGQYIYAGTTNTASDGSDKYGLYVAATGAYTGLAGIANNVYGIYSTVGGGDNNYAGIFTGGNVGIGTAIPGSTYELHVATATLGEKAIYSENTAVGNAEGYGIHARSINNPGWGTGGYFEGGFRGILVDCGPTSYASTAYGAYVTIDGTASSRIGTYSRAFGSGTTNYGVQGIANGAATGTNYGVYGQASGATTNNYAIYGAGNGAVTGSFAKASGTFKIDHPQDPANKYLYHSFVESPDMMNLYNGNVTTNAAGEAWVELPGYFATLNKDFRYQLTVVGQFAQAIVAQKVENNRFMIKTNLPNVEVSWMVTGVRQDPWANQNRVVPEVEKTGEERGKYIHPHLYNQPDNMRIDYIAPDPNAERHLQDNNTTGTTTRMPNPQPQHEPVETGDGENQPRGTSGSQGVILKKLDK